MLKARNSIPNIFAERGHRKAATMDTMQSISLDHNQPNKADWLDEREDGRPVKVGRHIKSPLPLYTSTDITENHHPFSIISSVIDLCTHNWLASESLGHPRV